LGSRPGIRLRHPGRHSRDGEIPPLARHDDGGSIATEFASELAPTYSPSLHIVATAEGGIPVDLFHNLKYIDGSPSWSGMIPASFVAVSRAFGLNLTPALSPYGLQLTRQVQHECINSFLGAYPGLTYQKLFRPQYRNIFKLPSFVAVTDSLIMSHTGTPRGPLLIGVGNSDGTGDGVMVAKDVQALAYTYCRRGVSVQFHEYAGDNHYSAAVAFEPEATVFLDARLTGKAEPNGCSSIGPGNSLAPCPCRNRACSTCSGSVHERPRAGSPWRSGPRTEHSGTSR
jgi:Secretory lipase